MTATILLPDMAQCREKLKLRFPDLSPTELDRLLLSPPAKFYKKGSVIYEESTKMKGCYFVYSGILKVYQTGREGKEQIIKFEQAGDLFGFRSVISYEPACTSVKTLSDTILCYISGTALLDLLKTNPGFAYEMIQIACKELGESNRYIRDIAQKSVKKRLAEILVMLAEETSPGKIWEISSAQPQKQLSACCRNIKTKAWWNLSGGKSNYSIPNA